MASRSSNGFAVSTPSPGNQTTEASSDRKVLFPIYGEVPPQAGKGRGRRGRPNPLTRQLDREGAPRPWLGLDPDRAAVSLHDSPGDGQAETAAGIAALKSLEEPRPAIFLHPGSVVRHPRPRPD